jgi:hypothetical protein
VQLKLTTGGEKPENPITEFPAQAILMTELNLDIVKFMLNGFLRPPF